MENTHDSQKVVIVTGDVTMDWNLAQTQRGDTHKVWNPEGSTRTYWQRGGAALLADLIDAIGDRLRENGQANFRIRQMDAPRDPHQVTPGDDQYHHSYALWSLFKYAENAPSGLEEEKAWRVKEFMGLDQNMRSRANGVIGDTTEADLVVLDDANLGFRELPELWPKVLTTGGNRPWIILKMARPVAQGMLWERLRSQFADRLIVVMAINDLRLTEVQISRELSWEQTAQDLVWELVHNPLVNTLSLCAHVVVSFYTAGAVLLSRPEQQNEATNKDAVPAGCLLFDPRVIEGMWEQNYPGSMMGYTSCLTAGIVQELMISQKDCDVRAEVQGGIQKGLVAMRALHMQGYGKRGAVASEAGLSFPKELIVTELAKQLEKQKPEFAEIKIQTPRRYPAPSILVSEKVPEASFWSILEDRYKDTLGQIAQQIVIKGAEAALEGVPLGQFGKLLTVDRREIENFRNIRALVGEYHRQGNQERPLSVAVFGAPGSGKSFGIVEVAKSLLPGQIEVRQYNLSQFSDPKSLLDALHQVRDVGLSGLIPLVFWDEFDSSLDGQPLGWLRHFLAPMQDGRFQQGQVTHSIGRSIFVFAGGVYESMETFGQKMKARQFQAAKGPDFVSRLKGYVNVMGPNRQKAIGGTNTMGDPYYIIRRAILLRSILLRYAPQLFNEEKELNIDSGVLRALLYTSEYTHGARSMESIVAMSLLSGKTRFERSCLPAMAQLDLHVDGADFQALVQRIELDGAVIEKLARLIHNEFCQRLRDEGYKWEPRTDDKRKLHSSLVPYEELPEEEKRQNIANAQDIPNKLSQVGYIVIPVRSTEGPVSFPPSVLEQLAQMEHERWLKAKLEAGWRWAPETKKDSNLHEDLLPWNKLSKKQRVCLYTPEGAKALGAGELPNKEKEKDRNLVRSIPQILEKVGYTIVKV